MWNDIIWITSILTEWCEHGRMSYLKDLHLYLITQVKCASLSTPCFIFQSFLYYLSPNSASKSVPILHTTIYVCACKSVPFLYTTICPHTKQYNLSTYYASQSVPILYTTTIYPHIRQYNLFPNCTSKSIPILYTTIYPHIR